jgi:hypothetical protein
MPVLRPVLVRRWLSLVVLLALPAAAILAPHADRGAASVVAQGASGNYVVGRVGGPAETVAVDGQHVYVGIGTEVTVLDAADPAHPSVVGRSAPLPCVVTDVVARDGLLYVVFGSGFTIFDLADPATPRETATWREAVSCAGGGAGTITLNGELAYTTGIVNFGHAFDQVFDVRDPNEIQWVGAFSSHGPLRSIAVGAGHAYAAENAWLYTYDLSDPARPVELGRLEPPGEIGYPLSVAWSDGHVFVGCSAGLFVADIALPGPPFLVTGSPVYDLLVRDGIAYLAAGPGAGLTLVDVHDPDHLVRLASVPIGDARGVAILGAHAYVAAGPDGLSVADVTTPASVSAEQVVSTFAVGSDVAVGGRTAFVAAADSGLVAVDLTDPTAPRTLDRVRLLGPATRLALDGDRAYVLTVRSGPPGTVHVIDVSDPSALRATGVVTLYGAAMAVDGGGGLAYVSDSVGGLRVFDSRPVDGPREVGAVRGERWTMVDLLVEGDHVYAVDATYGLRVIDVSDPARPREVGGLPYETQGRTGMAYSDGRLFVSETSYPLAQTHFGEIPQNLLVVDVTDPAHPRRVRTVELGTDGEFAFPRDIASDGQRILVASGTYGWRWGARGFGLVVAPIDDASPDASPWWLGMPDQAMSVAVSGDLAVVADGTAGLLVVRPDVNPTSEPTGARPTSTRPAGTVFPTPTAPATPTPVPIPTDTRVFLPVGHRG